MWYEPHRLPQNEAWQGLPDTMSLILPHYEHLSHNEPHYEAHQMSGRVKCECEYQCEQSERGVNTSCEQCRRGVNDVV